MGTLAKITPDKDNIKFTVQSELSPYLKVDQSLSHNGVCLTITKIDNHEYETTLIAETLEKSNLGNLEQGSTINLERAMLLNDRLDGHMVQGHVDTTISLLDQVDENGSTVCTFELPEIYQSRVVEKGSICLNGVSLTVFDVKEDRFSVAIIPYTWENTNFKQLQIGNKVNVEFDIIGKYLLKFYQVYGKLEPNSAINFNT